MIVEDDTLLEPACGQIDDVGTDRAAAYAVASIGGWDVESIASSYE